MLKSFRQNFKRTLKSMEQEFSLTKCLRAKYRLGRLARGRAPSLFCSALRYFCRTSDTAIATR